MIAFLAGVVLEVALSEWGWLALLFTLSLALCSVSCLTLWRGVLPWALVVVLWRWWMWVASLFTSGSWDTSWVGWTFWAWLAFSIFTTCWQGLLHTFLVTSGLDLSAVFVLSWLAWGALSSSWVALSMWFSTSSGAESSGVTCWIRSHITFLTLFGIFIALWVGDFFTACIMATQSIWELTIVALWTFLWWPVASVSLAISSSEISWACEVIWLSSFESTTFEDSLSYSSVAEGSTQAPSTSDTLMFSNTSVAVSKTVTFIIWSISIVQNY